MLLYRQRLFSNAEYIQKSSIIYIKCYLERTKVLLWKKMSMKQVERFRIEQKQSNVYREFKCAEENKTPFVCVAASYFSFLLCLKRERIWFIFILPLHHMKQSSKNTQSKILITLSNANSLICSLFSFYSRTSIESACSMRVYVPFLQTFSNEYADGEFLLFL